MAAEHWNYLRPPTANPAPPILVFASSNGNIRMIIALGLNEGEERRYILMDVASNRHKPPDKQGAISLAKESIEQLDFTVGQVTPFSTDIESGLGFRTSCCCGGPGLLDLEDFCWGGLDQATWLILGGDDRPAQGGVHVGERDG